MNDIDAVWRKDAVLILYYLYIPQVWNLTHQKDSLRTCFTRTAPRMQ